MYGLTASTGSASRTCKDPGQSPINLSDVVTHSNHVMETVLDVVVCVQRSLSHTVTMHATLNTRLARPTGNTFIVISCERVIKTRNCWDEGWGGCFETLTSRIFDSNIPPFSVVDTRMLSSVKYASAVSESKKNLHTDVGGGKVSTMMWTDGHWMIDGRLLYD